MLVKKSGQEIIRDAMNLITENTPITNLNSGSIARSIVEATAGEYENLYEFAETVLHNGYLSRADEEHLIYFGELFNYPRRIEVVVDPETGDRIEQLITLDTYRYELSKQVTAAVSSNEEALRLAILPIPGVQSIVGKEYTHGTGSFSFIVTTLYGFDTEAVKVDIENAIQEKKGFGIRPEVVLPADIPLEMQLQIIFKESTPQKDSIRYKIQSELMNYFGNFKTDQDFIYNDFVKEVMDMDENIVDFKLNYFYLNDMPALLTNHTVLEEERIRPRLIDVL
ncbi:MAG: hypothetical protein IJ880_04065 [Bacilli bacterium]|nr:hypothetical protein [Bacilli bacterium]MBR3119861.1 hypothetical protein [Oceanobacillus sp.]